MLGFLQLAPSNGGLLRRDRLINKDVLQEGMHFHNTWKKWKLGMHIFRILGSRQEGEE